MAVFRYKMIRRDGQLLNGVMELPFATGAAASEYLEKRGLTIVTLERLNDMVGRFILLAGTVLNRHIRREELIEFLRNLGVMLRSGVPILTTLEDATAYSENHVLMKIAEEIRLDIETGMQFADAVDRHQEVFPDTVRHLIRIGEETGNLSRTLIDAADHLDRLEKITSDTKKSLIYPGFVLVSLLAATMFWIYYVIPSVSDLFRNMNVELPWITQFVLSAVESIEKNFFFVTISLALAILIAYLCVKLVSRIRLRFHRLLTKLPVTGKIVRASNLAFIAEYFSLFTASGVDIMKSLETLQSAVKNDFYREKIAAIRDGLQRGNTLTTEFGRSNVFPSFVVRMINVGEQSGTLTEQLQYVADDYRRRLNDIVERIAEITKPVAILIVGGFFIFIIIALFLPIYHLVGQISTRGAF